MKSVLQKVFMLVSAVMMSAGLFAQNEGVRVIWFDGDDVLDGNFYEVSSNGRYAVGAVNGVYTFLWDRSTGETVVIKGADDSMSEGYDVSNNGVIAGNIFNAETGFPGAAFYMNGVWTLLPSVEGVELFDYNYPSATCISNDGTVVGGMVDAGGMKFSAATWTNGNLDPLFDGCNYSLGGRAVSMSGDGKTLGGWAYDEEDRQGAAVWNRDWTPNIKKLSTVGWTHRISASGEYAVGEYTPENGDITAFIWSEKDGMVALPKLEGYRKAVANSVSDNGIVLGYNYKDLMDRNAFIYKDGVIYQLEDYLSEFYGYVNESGNTLFMPMSISASGKTICGWGENPNGRRLPWLILIGEEDYVGVNDVAKEESNFNIWNNGNVINIDNSSENSVNVQVIDMTGRVVKSLSANSGMSSVAVNNDGIYVVKVGNVAKKVVVKR